MPESAALNSFRTLLGLSDQLLKLESGYADPPLPLDVDTVHGLRGGAAVLMVAAFEAYLKAGIAELLKPLLGPPLKPRQSLPMPLQIAGIFDSLDLAMNGPRHGKPKGKAGRLADVVAAATKIASGELDVAAISQTRSNPGSETVTRILKNVGFKKPFDDLRPTFDQKWIKPEASTFVADKLDEIVKRRHRVAHTADISAISRGDLATAIVFLRTLGEVIDEDVQQAVASM